MSTCQIGRTCDRQGDIQRCVRATKYQGRKVHCDSWRTLLLPAKRPGGQGTRTLGEWPNPICQGKCGMGDREKKGFVFVRGWPHFQLRMCDSFWSNYTPLIGSAIRIPIVLAQH